MTLLSTSWRKVSSYSISVCIPYIGAVSALSVRLSTSDTVMMSPGAALTSV